MVITYLVTNALTDDSDRLFRERPSQCFGRIEQDRIQSQHGRLAEISCENTAPITLSATEQLKA